MSTNIKDRKLVLRFLTGTDNQGKDITRTKTINNVRVDASEEQMERFASKYGELSNHIHLESMVVNSHALTKSEA